MPYKDKEYAKEHDKEYRSRPKVRARIKEYLSKPEIIAKRKEYAKTYISKPEKKELRQKYRQEHKEERAAYYATNKEKLNRQSHENYLKNREAVLQRTSKYHFEHKEQIKKYHKENYGEIRLEILAKIDPAMKCARCGCDETRFLDVNHIKGGGYEEHKKRGKKVTKNMILLIHTGKRGVEDLNLLCRICNALDYLERKHGPTRLRVVWDKPVTNTPVPSLDQVLSSL